MKKQLILGVLLSTAFLSSGPVWAETADDVDCSGCITGDEIAKKAITSSNIKGGAVGEAKIKNGAVTMNKLSDEVRDAINNASPAQTGVYVGFSSSRVNGGVGFAGMAQACQADFGPSSRIASSAEIVGLTSFPTELGFGWVKSSGDPDSSGHAGINDCDGFSNQGGNGLAVIGADYRFQSQPCALQIFVACSAVQ